MLAITPRMMEAPSSSAADKLERNLGQRLPTLLSRQVQLAPDRALLPEIVIGAVAGLIAVGVRLMLPLDAQQLPTITVVVMLAVVTAFVGVRAGIATAIVGGLLAWYLLFNPHSWSLANDARIPLRGFAVIATVIVSTSHLYRSSERLSHAR